MFQTTNQELTFTMTIHDYHSPSCFSSESLTLQLGSLNIRRHQSTEGKDTPNAPENPWERHGVRSTVLPVVALVP